MQIPQVVEEVLLLVFSIRRTTISSGPRQCLMCEALDTSHCNVLVHHGGGGWKSCKVPKVPRFNFSTLSRPSGFLGALSRVLKLPLGAASSRWRRSRATPPPPPPPTPPQPPPPSSLYLPYPPPNPPTPNSPPSPSPPPHPPPPTPPSPPPPLPPPLLFLLLLIIP